MNFNRSMHVVWSAFLTVGLTAPMPLHAAVSVMDFGAAGDGKADDSEAFRQALAAARGQVQVPPGQYVVKDVKIPDGIALHGEGAASVVQTPPDAAYAFTTGIDCEIRRIKFVGHPDDKAPPITTGFIRVATEGVTLSDLVFENAHRGGIVTDHA